MPQLRISNFSKQPIEIGIEPWADVETLVPDEKMEIEYTEPADVGFAVVDNCNVVVSVVSDTVVVKGKGAPWTWAYPGSST